VRESVVTFGQGGGLVGIVTEPDAMPAGDPRPAMIQLNVGLLHRPGPFRVSVDMARALAARGFASLRFDLSGIGDSDVRRDRVAAPDRAVADIREAMDSLAARRGTRTFVLLGNCTGAVNAYAAALADPRVCGAVLIDGYGYRTWRFYLHRYGPFLLDPFRLASYLSWRGRRAAACLVRRDAARESEDASLGWQAPPKPQVQAGLARLLERGVRVLPIFSGDGQTRKYYNYHEQFRDTFRSLDFRGLVEVEFYRDADHIFSQTGARQRLIARVCDWMQTHYAT
jgi:pimeloyl-ACP methyl ester carboxylesterase